MKRKKILLILLALCLALSLIPAAAFAASAELVIETPETLPKAGDDFTVTVSIRNNPGFNAIDLCLAYDSTQMDCSSINLEKLMQGMLSATNPKAKSGAIISAATLNVINGDGILATYFFTALKDIDSINFTLKNTGLYTEDGNEIAFSAVGGVLENSEKTDSENQDIEVKEPEKEEQNTGTEEPENVEQGGHSESGSDAPIVTDLQGGSKEAFVFNDISRHWAKDAVAKAVEKDLFSGYPDGSFKPDLEVSRAEFVTVLWKLAGKPECSEITPFVDVKGSDWFAVPVAWAYSKGYVSGTSKTTFGPNDSVSREQAMTILYKYDGCKPGMEAMFTSAYDQNYVDSSQISSWAKQAMYWGVYNKLISGTSATTLSPKKPATRAQLAVILVYYCDEYIE